MTNHLYFVYEGVRYPIALDTASAPATIAQLLLHVPARIDLHCAKIAGRHILWHAPFIAELESPRDVMTVVPGTFLYWPERQFLELTYGELQAESAQITVLGQLVGDVDWLVELAETLRHAHGHRILWARLESDMVPRRPAPGPGAGPASPSPELRHTALEFLRESRQRVWNSEPECVRELVSRRGILLPWGPLAMAEAEFRKLQELLWRLMSSHGEGFSAAERARTASFLINAFRSRIVDLCGMQECAPVLDSALECLLNSTIPNDEVLRELILYCGRLAAWLDLYIPWNDLNDAVLGARTASR